MLRKAGDAPGHKTVVVVFARVFVFVFFFFFCCCCCCCCCCWWWWCRRWWWWCFGRGCVLFLWLRYRTRTAGAHAKRPLETAPFRRARGFRTGFCLFFLSEATVFSPQKHGKVQSEVETIVFILVSRQLKTDFNIPLEKMKKGSILRRFFAFGAKKSSL